MTVKAARRCLLLLFLPWSIIHAESDDPSGLLLRIAALERTRAEKQACDAKFPDYRRQTQAAFDSYADSRLTASQIVESAPSSETRQKLLRALPEIQAKIQADVLQLRASRPQRMKWACENFDSVIQSFSPPVPTPPGKER